MKSIPLIFLFFFILSCSQDLAEKEEPVNIVAKKPLIKKEKAALKVKKLAAKSGKKVDYWIELKEALSLSNKQFLELKELDTDFRKGLGEFKGNATKINSIKNEYSKSKNLLLGRKLSIKKKHFDIDWKNPLSIVRLKYRILLDENQLKVITKINRAYLKKIRAIPISIVNGKKQRDLSKMKLLFDEKEKEIIAKLTQTQSNKYFLIKKKINSKLLNTAEPFAGKN